MPCTRNSFSTAAAMSGRGHLPSSARTCPKRTILRVLNLWRPPTRNEDKTCGDPQHATKRHVQRAGEVGDGRGRVSCQLRFCTSPERQQAQPWPRCGGTAFWRHRDSCRSRGAFLRATSQDQPGWSCDVNRLSVPAPADGRPDVHHPGASARGGQPRARARGPVWKGPRALTLLPPSISLLACTCAVHPEAHQHLLQRQAAEEQVLVAPACEYLSCVPSGVLWPCTRPRVAHHAGMH
jgi:hypothetical protein